LLVFKKNDSPLTRGQLQNANLKRTISEQKPSPVPELPALSQKLEQMARKKTGKWERKWENGKNGTTETDAAGLRDQAEIPRLRSG